MKASEIRSAFLNYYKQHGHTEVESASLVPSNDPTLLFTSAGMVQFKDVFTGKEKRPYTRATSSQKCLRAGGKHNDLENVGFTARHHTFFEMLGNFSFGDYFKKDAIHFAWELVTKELGIPKDKLFVTVFETDDEAADIWHKQEGVPKDRIYRFGEKDNFWSAGDTGPCGPCSEIFVDRGEKYGPGQKMGDDGDRFMEIYNLVFMQFNRDASGKLNPLPKPSVDTGAGLERIASFLQNVNSNYDTDLFQAIIQKTSALVKVPYIIGDLNAPSFRVIADHARATAFLITDGVTPSNEGRGYVLRRIMRRAIRHGKKLGFTGPFFHHTCDFVIDQMKDAYPALKTQREFILKAVLAEEEQFLRTLERGLSLLDEEIKKLGSGSKILPANATFMLYDTYGFPLDLTRTIAEERGIGIDEAGFEKAMEKQRSESRKNWKGSGEEAVGDVYFKVAEELKKENLLPAFKGYDSLTHEGKCVAVIPTGRKDGIVEAVFNPTPFYGESGGQAGDKGRVKSSDGLFEAEVVDVQKPVSDLIVTHLKPVKGELKKGASYSQETNADLRALTARNHTATHLLHWALREVLGTHVKQAGSLVNADLLRFDFAHFQAMTAEELRKVEDLINEKIWSNDSVSKIEMSKDDAMKKGAIAMFGEKYGERVRVVSVGPENQQYSVEFCGGTHVDRSSDIHFFKIFSESGIASGVRRIIAYTSKGAFDYLRARDEDIKNIRDRLKASNFEEVFIKLDKLSQTEKELRKEIEKFSQQGASQEVDSLLSQATAFSGGKFLAAVCKPDANGMKRLRDLADQIKAKDATLVAVLGIEEPGAGKCSVVVSVGTKAQSKLKANEILQKLLPLIDGKGGGKPDFAQAGGTKPSGLNALVEEAKKLSL